MLLFGCIGRGRLCASKCASSAEVARNTAAWIVTARPTERDANRASLDGLARRNRILVLSQDRDDLIAADFGLADSEAEQDKPLRPGFLQLLLHGGGFGGRKQPVA
jgi:hypothetical protein